MKNRILGIDPGTQVVGYGVIECEGTSMRLLAADVLRAPKGAPLAERLAHISAALEAVVAKWQPQCAAVEDVFVKADPRAALAIGHGRGALLAVLGRHGLLVADYPPATIKRSVAGNGRAPKQQVARMVGTILGLGALPTPLDATDALATAITHSLKSRTQIIVKK